MDVIGIVKSGLDSFLAVFNWQTGGRTKDENALRNSVVHWRDVYADAIARHDVDTANHALRELQRVRNEAAAKSP